MSELKQEELLEIIWGDILKKLKGKNHKHLPTDFWAQQFYALKCYIAQYKKYPLYFENENLSRWVSKQRSLKKSGELSQICLEILNDYGFIWENAIEQHWNSKYDNVKQYLKKHKSYPSKSENNDLCCWVTRQRAAKKNGTILKKQQEKLDAIGFVWTKQDALLAKWFKVFDRYKAFVEKQGDFPTNGTNIPLSQWASGVRLKKKQGELSKQQLAALDKINFEWNEQTYTILDKAWDKTYTELETYIKTHGTYPTRNNKATGFLYKWYCKQIHKRNTGKLNLEQQQKLEKLNWKTAVNILWETNYNKLNDFIKKHNKYPIQSIDKPLNKWVISQRNLKRKNKLSPERVAKLDAIYFIWDVSDMVWEETCCRLKHWISTHKRSPKHTTERGLRRWLYTQKKRKIAGELSKNQEFKLDEVVRLTKKYSKSKNIKKSKLKI